MKFIIKVHNWCVAFVEGDIRDLKNKLAEFGCEFDTKKPCKEENLGVHFDEVITTKLKCIGRDDKLEDLIAESIRDAIVNKTQSLKLAENLLDSFDFQRIVGYYCEYRNIISNVVSIYCSTKGKEDYNPAPGHYICPREYDSIDGITEEDFWHCLRKFGFNKPE